MTINLAQMRNMKVHLIGIGGAGMSGVARILISEGAIVSGSDMKDSSVLSGLRAIGVHTFIGHSSKNVHDTELIVRSSAILDSNPEMQEAARLGVAILTRAQALAIVMSESKSVAVAGTHGKTTTTSMLTVALQVAGLDPSFAIGGVLTASGSNAHKGSGELFIAEADESDGSFIEYRPFGAIITNIEHDHVDSFPTPEAVFSAFGKFVSTISRDGFLVYCQDDSGARSIAFDVDHCQVLSYGTDNSSDLRLDRIELHPTASTARALWKGISIGTLEISVPGLHNILNAAAALTAGIALGLPPTELMSGLSSFRGAGRRFELKGQIHGIRVVDDYGHHPTEIDVTLKAARLFAGSGRVLAIFQPHRFSRTQAFTNNFALALDLADQIWVLEVYSAGEKAIAGVSGSAIVQKMKKGIFEPNFVSVIAEVVDFAQPGDVILTLGAGDVSSLAPLLLDALTVRYPNQ